MAKLSAVVKNERRKKLVAKYAEQRAALKETIRNPNSTQEQVAEAYRKLRKLPRDSSPTRVVNRCEITGRPRAVYRRFGLSRIAFRELALGGHIPGVKKSSW